MFGKKNNQGVSPVIGVILMVAVAVALVALVTLVVFDIGDDVSEPADVTVNTELDESNGDLIVEVVRNENVDKLVAQGNGVNSGPVEVITSEGAVGTEAVNLTSSGGDVELVATVDGNEEIVRTVNATLP